MDLTGRWPPLAELTNEAEVLGGLEVWAFGSMLNTDEPHDLDVAVIYQDRAKLTRLRTMKPWELMDPPVDLIGLTQDEDFELQFLRGVRAVRLIAPRSKQTELGDDLDLSPLRPNLGILFAGDRLAGGIWTNLSTR